MKNNNRTTAEQIARILEGNAGRSAAEGGRTIADFALDFGGHSREQQAQSGLTVTRWGFADGSALVDRGAAWFVEGRYAWFGAITRGAANAALLDLRASRFPEAPPYGVIG
jgi:hypothetical protein